MAGAASFLGAGWDFPPARDGAAGQRPFALAEGEESIRQSVWLILSTARGERVMRPEFGCGIHELVFAPNGPATRGLAEHEVREALRAFEPRIQVLRVSASAGGEHGERLLIEVDYRIRATDSRFNLVYPFYLDRETF